MDEHLSPRLEQRPDATMFDQVCELVWPNMFGRWGEGKKQ